MKNSRQEKYDRHALYSRDTELNLSTVGMGTYLGLPTDEDDFDLYIALKYLLKSGSINVIDTAINYRC